MPMAGLRNDPDWRNGYVSYYKGEPLVTADSYDGDKNKWTKGWEDADADDAG
jgi:hypothetical protein